MEKYRPWCSDKEQWWWVMTNLSNMLQRNKIKSLLIWWSMLLIAWCDKPPSSIRKERVLWSINSILWSMNSKFYVDMDIDPINNHFQKAQVMNQDWDTVLKIQIKPDSSILFYEDISVAWHSNWKIDEDERVWIFQSPNEAVNFIESRSWKNSEDKG